MPKDTSNSDRALRAAQRALNKQRRLLNKAYRSQRIHKDESLLIRLIKRLFKRLF